MTVMKSGISWTDSTWNFAVGCNKVSEGCRFCYAERLVERLTSNFGQSFDEVTLHLERLAHVRKFRPLVGPDGQLQPRKVFVNSMSDWAHEKIPDDAVHQVFDVMEQHPTIVFQMLTKRPVRARKVLVDRYSNRGLPANIWIGASVESNEVDTRIRILRSIKERVGGMTAFLSVEPIVGPTDQLDFVDIDWIITGGESGPHARVMERRWLFSALEAADRAGAAIWHKQNGQIRSHPNLSRAPADLGVTAKFQWLVDNCWEILPAEKGGATVDHKTYRSLPPSYAELAGQMNKPRI